MHIISPLSIPPLSPFFLSLLQENMAAVHTCFVPHAALTSLEVVSHTGKGGEVGVGGYRGVGAHQPAWKRRSLGAGGVKAPLCVSLFMAVGTKSVLYRGRGVRLLPPFHPLLSIFLFQTSLGNTTVKLLF